MRQTINIYNNITLLPGILKLPIEGVIVCEVLKIRYKIVTQICIIILHDMLKKYLPLISFVLLWFMSQNIPSVYAETSQVNSPSEDNPNADQVVNVLKDDSDLRLLIQQLSNPEPEERVKALKAMGEKGDPLAAEPILAALKDRKTAVRDAAFAALNKLVESLKVKQDVKTLGMILQYPDNIIRQLAIKSLGDIPTAQSAEMLIGKIADPDERIRDKTVEALKKIGRPAAEPLIQSLKSDDIRVRINCVMLLREIGDKRAVEPLIEMLQFHSDDVAVDSIRLRLESATALGRIRDPLAGPALINALRDTSPQVRERAALALQELGPAVADQLIKVLMDENLNVRVNAARILGEIKDAGSVEPLIQALLVDMDEDKSWLFRVEAAKALGKIKDPRAIESLNMLLSDRVSYVRDMAAWAINEISGKGAEKKQDSWWKKIFD
jgi:HEAT repeat protein